MNPGIDKCINEALDKLEPQSFYGPGGEVFHQNSSVCVDDCDIFVWKQAWSDTTCGYGGVGGQMITGSLAVIVVGPTMDACVYHGGRLAYKIDKVSDKFFWDCINSRSMPGRTEWKKRKLLSKETESAAV